jgi:hypothetical protein
MSKKTLSSLTFGALLFISATLHAESDILNSQTGVVQVFVEDENGASVPNAPVYITDGHHIQYMETSSLGAVSVDLQEGQYRLSSAITRTMPDCIDRYASPEAHVQVVPQDTTSVILTLRFVDDPISKLSMSTLKKIGVADEVAKYNN